MKTKFKLLALFSAPRISGRAASTGGPSAPACRCCSLPEDCVYGGQLLAPCACTDAERHIHQRCLLRAISSGIKAGEIHPGRCARCEQGFTLDAATLGELLSRWQYDRMRLTQRWLQWRQRASRPLDDDVRLGGDADAVVVWAKAGLEEAEAQGGRQVCA